MAEAPIDRPLVEPKLIEENTMNNDQTLEIDRSVEEEKATKKVSFTESLMPFEKPKFFPQVPGASQQMQNDIAFQQVLTLSHF